MPITETDPVLKATNTNRTVIKSEVDGNMSSSFSSSIIDFHDMPIGYLQAVWKDVVGFGPDSGYFEAFASGFRNFNTFDYIRGSLERIEVADGARMWNLGVIGYRYAYVKFSPVNITDGTCTIIASGKKT